MDDKDYKAEFEESTVNEDSTPVQQNRSILEEIIKLEEQMKDPKNQIFKKTTYWNQLNNTQDNQNHEVILKEIIECLLRIEYKLTQIGNLLE